MTHRHHNHPEHVLTLEEYDHLKSCHHVRDDHSTHSHEYAHYYGKPVVVSADEIRRKLQDFTEVNIPLGIEYLTDEDLMECLEHTIADFNETPPIFRFRQFDVHDFPYKHLALIGAVTFAFDLTKKKELRGEMSYSDGGIDSTIYHKTAAFQSLYAESMQEYENRKVRIKRQMNIEACYGGMR